MLHFEWSKFFITLKISSYWNGIIDDKWETAGNWSCGVAPDKFSDVYINSGNVRYPQVMQNGAACKSLTLQPNTSTKINVGKDIKIYGN